VAPRFVSVDSCCEAVSNAAFASSTRLWPNRTHRLQHPEAHHKPSTSRGVVTTVRIHCHPERFIYRHDRTDHSRCNSHRHIAQQHTFSSFGIQSRVHTWHARTTRREKRCLAHKSHSARCRHCIALGNLSSSRESLPHPIRSPLRIHLNRRIELPVTSF
jgi:hypothetical protein